MKMRALGGFSWVIPVYHWGNQTRENQEADQGPQSMKKPPSPATERFCRPWMPVKEAAPNGAEQRMPNKCTIIRDTCQALK